MNYQYYGTVDGDDGKELAAMLCIDADEPLIFMLHLWGPDTAVHGVLLQAEPTDDETVKLHPRQLLRRADNGSLYLPPLSSEEWNDVIAHSAILRKQGHKFEGEWTHTNGKRGKIRLHELPGETEVAAIQCESWNDFKTWAGTARNNHDLVVFRGHGNRDFRLETTLHRAGRTRLDRYCAGILNQFHVQAEAVLGLRLNMDDGNDYAVVFGLAQHHGLPTPLLDWTESPYIAAFFAFADALNYESSRPNATHVRIYGLTNRFISANSPSSVVVPSGLPYVASLQVSPRLNARLQAQQGRFLVTNIVNLERYIVRTQPPGEPAIQAIDVPIEFAREALEDLKYMGVTAANMFPGLDGVCTQLKHEMAFRRKAMPIPGLPIGESPSSQASTASEPAPPPAV